MSPAKLVLGFVPVILYSVMVNWAGEAWVPAAAIAALVVAAGLVVQARISGKTPKMLIAASAAVFAAYAVASLLDQGSEHFLAGYGRALAALILAVVVFATLPVLPFTEQFAREMVPAHVVATPQFRELNRRLSAVWGVVVLGLAAGHAAATALSGQLGRGGELLLSWGVPAVLLLAAVRFTSRLTAGARPQPARTAL
jgi:hypothetical protein